MPHRDAGRSADITGLAGEDGELSFHARYDNPRSVIGYLLRLRSGRYQLELERFCHRAGPEIVGARLKF
jgi:hypothetical protein